MILPRNRKEYNSYKRGQSRSFPAAFISHIDFMRIAWFCIPAYGHTNPTLGIVKELTAAGHQIFYFSFELYRDQIERAGAVFIGCDGYDFDMEDKENADRVGKDMAFATELLVNSTLALDEMTTKKVEEIKPDLVVSDSVAYWGKLVALKHELP